MLMYAWQESTNQVHGRLRNGDKRQSTTYSLFLVRGILACHNQNPGTRNEIKYACQIRTFSFNVTTHDVYMPGKAKQFP